jgi:hypothetical protein
MTLSSDDRFEILDLFSRYAHSIDTGAAEACADCFRGDGRLQVGDGPPVVGTDALRSFALDWRASFRGVPRHISWHVILERISDHEAKGTASTALIRTTAAGATIVFSGTYSDTYTRDANGAWKIAERLVAVDRDTVPP